MSDTKKYLDYEGVKYLWSKINMNDYPNNETLINVIEAIDETKADRVIKNKYTIDMAAPVTISTYDFAMENKVVTSGTAIYGEVSVVDGVTFVYTPTAILQGVDTVTLSFDDGSSYDVYVYPADSIYYNARFFPIGDGGWSLVEEDNGNCYITSSVSGDKFTFNAPFTGIEVYGNQSTENGSFMLGVSNFGEKVYEIITMSSLGSTNSVKNTICTGYQREEHGLCTVLIIKSGTKPVQLTGFRILNTIIDENPTEFAIIPEYLKTSNSDTDGTKTSMVKLLYNNETKKYERTIKNNFLSRIECGNFLAFEINPIADNPHIELCCNTALNSTIGYVDFYNSFVGASYCKSCKITSDNIYHSIFPIKYNNKDYIVIKALEDNIYCSDIKFVNCELVTHVDQTAVDTFIFDVIKIANGTLIVTRQYVDDAIPAIPEQVQSDWNQNDEVALDYVKNRPFYEKTDTVKIVLFDGDVQFNEEDMGPDMLVVIGYYDEPKEFENGKTYTVTIENEQQDIVCENNALIFVSSELNMTFRVTESEVYIDEYDSYEPSYHIKIETTEVSTVLKQLDEKFIPDTIARTSDLLNSGVATLPVYTYQRVSDKTSLYKVNLADLKNGILYSGRGLLESSDTDITLIGFVIVCEDGTEKNIAADDGNELWIIIKNTKSWVLYCKTGNSCQVIDFTDLSTAANVTCTWYHNYKYLDVNNTYEYTPTNDYNPATKKYVDDTATTAANAIKNDLLNGAGEAYDTLKELGELIDDNVDAIEALEIIATGKANISDIPTKVSELTNDSGFITKAPQADWTQTDETATNYIKNKPILATSEEIKALFN